MLIGKTKQILKQYVCVWNLEQNAMYVFIVKKIVFRVSCTCLWVISVCMKKSGASTFMTRTDTSEFEISMTRTYTFKL